MGASIEIGHLATDAVISTEAFREQFRDDPGRYGTAVPLGDGRWRLTGHFGDSESPLDEEAFQWLAACEPGSRVEWAGVVDDELLAWSFVTQPDGSVAYVPGRVSVSFGAVPAAPLEPSVVCVTGAEDPTGELAAFLSVARDRGFHGAEVGAMDALEQAAREAVPGAATWGDVAGLGGSGREAAFEAALKARGWLLDQAPWTDCGSIAFWQEDAGNALED